MKAIFQKYLDVVLIVCAVAFVAVIVMCGMESIGNLAQQASRAFGSGVSQPSSPTFNLPAAAALDLRGLTPANPSQ